VATIGAIGATLDLDAIYSEAKKSARR